MDDGQGKEKNGSTYSRRRFLRHSAALAGALVTYPLLSNPIVAAAQSAGRSSKAGRPLKVGVLLPRSSYYPDLATSFLAGMALYSGRSYSHEITVISEDVGSGSRNVRQKVEAMLQKEKVGLMVGMVTPGVAASVRDLFEASKTAFIASNSGENVPRQNEYSPHIFYHTLNLWQANWALGDWAARYLGTKCVLASSFYESGYDTLYAFRAGFESAGGEIAASLVTHQPGADTGFAPLIETIRETRPDLVFAGYYNHLAADLVRAYSSAGFSGVVPLVGTAYLTDEQVLGSAGNATAGVKTAFSWTPTLSTPENQAFVAAYRSETGKLPNTFALLGFEAAQMIASAVDLANANGRSLVDALAAVSFTGPRGIIDMNKQTHSTTGPIDLREVQQYGNALQNVALAQLESNSEQDGKVAALRASEKTGWLSTYLCG